MDERTENDSLPSKGRIMRRAPNTSSSRQQGVVETTDRAEVNHFHRSEDNIEPVDPLQIERIIRERRQRFNDKRQKAKNEKKVTLDNATNRSKCSSQEGFQERRAQRKDELRHRMNQLENRVQKSKKSQCKVHIEEYKQDSPVYDQSPDFHEVKPTREDMRIPDRVNNETFKQLLKEMRLRHREELESLSRHHQMKIRSLESMLRSKDSIIRQLELEASRTREYVLQLQKALNSA